MNTQGFEGSFFRALFHKKHAAVDGRFFSFAFLCIWVVISLAGLMTVCYALQLWLVFICKCRKQTHTLLLPPSSPLSTIIGDDRQTRTFKA